MSTSRGDLWTSADNERSSDTGISDSRREMPDSSSSSRRPLTANLFRRTRSISNATTTWRRRHKSLVLNLDEPWPHDGGAMPHSPIKPSIEGSSRSGPTWPEAVVAEGGCHASPVSPKLPSSLKGKVRRASMGIMGMVHSHHRHHRSSSESVSSGRAAPQQHARPTTAHSAWNRLRQATSFRHSRTSHGGREELETIYSPVESNFSGPVQDTNYEPPVIPPHSGGAAKAAANSQNQYLETWSGSQSEYLTLTNLLGQKWLADESQTDRESGIGIALTATVSQMTTTSGDTNISRVDFMSWLPPELATQVLGYLDASNLAAVSRVCRAWNNIARDQHVWRNSFMREHTATYATTSPVRPATGMGIPPVRPDSDWEKIYKAKQELEKKWKGGSKGRATYLSGHLDSIYCVQFDESKIITGSRDKTIRIWDMHTYRCHLVIGPPGVVNTNTLLWGLDGKPVHFAASSASDPVLESLPATVSFATHHDASILCLQYDDEMLVTGSSDATCIVYSIKSGYRPIRRLHGHTAAVLDLAFDDKHIVTSSKDISVCVWDRHSGTLLKQLKGHTGPVNAVQLRGNTIVSCSGDFKVKLWNLDSGKIIREFNGHTRGLACSQFSEDGRFIASAGSDKVIRIWDANTGECMHEMEAHHNLVRSLHIDSVTGRLISGSYDTDIKVFDMESGKQLLDFPKWHASWVLSAKSDYRRIVSTGQDPKILIMDFGADVKDIEMLESGSAAKSDVFRDAGFI